MLLRPGRKAWLSALEMDFPASSLNDLHSSYAKGDRLAVTVVKGDEEDAEGKVTLTTLPYGGERTPPKVGERVVARVNRELKPYSPAPSLGVELRGGYTGRLGVEEVGGNNPFKIDGR